MAYVGNTSFAAQGWECPKCGSVYSPWTMKCPDCGPKTVTASTNTWTEWKAPSTWSEGESKEADD